MDLGIRDKFGREDEWFNRLRASEAQRILFICGDAHSDSFSKRLDNAGVASQVISRNWGQGWECID
jgi:hypothetical protein